MNISNVEANNAVLLTSLSSKTKPEEVNVGTTSAISDTFSESDETAKFKEIVDKYDITNMSRNEANQMYKELYDNKLINLKDVLVTIDPTRIPEWKDGVSTINGVKYSSNPDAKMNWLENLKTQVEYNKKYGNVDFQSLYDEKLGLAEKIKYFQTNV